MAKNNVAQLLDQTIQASNLSVKQQTVLRVSLDLFAEQGFDRTTSSEIAARAGVSEGTVFKTFKTKRGILNALLQPFLQQVIPIAADEFMAELQNNQFADLGAFLTYAVHDRMTFVMANRKQIKIFLQEIIREPTTIEPIATKWQQVLNGPLAQLFTHFKATGQLVDWPNARIARYVISTMVGYIVPNVMFNAPATAADIERQSQEAAEFLQRGLAAN